MLAWLLIVGIGRLMRESTGIVLFGDRADWKDFLAGFGSVIPNADIVLLEDPELDNVAYVDALQDCLDTFEGLLCQVPNKRAARLVAARARPTVTVASDPNLLAPGVVCNIVSSEQALVNAMLKHDRVVDGKKVLVTTTKCRTPTGWSQLHAEGGLQPVLHSLSAMKVGAVMVSDPALTAPGDLDALRLAAPGALLYVATSTDTTVPHAECQVSTNKFGAGQLAAGMLRLGAGYRGPQTLVVDPRTLMPSAQLIAQPATSLASISKLVRADCGTKTC